MAAENRGWRIKSFNTLYSDRKITN